MNHMPVKKPNSICLNAPNTGELARCFKPYNPWPEKGDIASHLGPELWAPVLSLILSDRNKMADLWIHVTFTDVVKAEAGRRERRSHDQSTAQPGFEHRSSCSKNPSDLPVLTCLKQVSNFSEVVLASLSTPGWLSLVSASIQTIIITEAAQWPSSMEGRACAIFMWLSSANEGTKHAPKAGEMAPWWRVPTALLVGPGLATRAT